MTGTVRDPGHGVSRRGATRGKHSCSEGSAPAVTAPSCSQAPVLAGHGVGHLPQTGSWDFPLPGALENPGESISSPLACWHSPCCFSFSKYLHFKWIRGFFSCISSCAGNASGSPVGAAAPLPPFLPPGPASGDARGSGGCQHHGQGHTEAQRALGPSGADYVPREGLVGCRTRAGCWVWPQPHCSCLPTSPPAALTSACPPGVRVLLQRSHFRQNLCQSLPREETFSAAGRHERAGERLPGTSAQTRAREGLRLVRGCPTDVLAPPSLAVHAGRFAAGPASPG